EALGLSDAGGRAVPAPFAVTVSLDRKNTEGVSSRSRASCAALFTMGPFAGAAAGTPGAPGAAPAAPRGGADPSTSASAVGPRSGGTVESVEAACGPSTLPKGGSFISPVLFAVLS